VNVRIQTRWGFDEVRRAALALAREVERRAPDLVTTKWWKEERHGVFLDYNQNAKDRTVASAYSVRATPDARVSAPLTWDEVATCHLSDFTLSIMTERFAQLGDLTALMDESAGSLDSLLELARKQQAEGQGDAPWPPHFRKQKGEAPRVQPSKRKDLPVITVSKAAKLDDARAGLERWKKRHQKAAGYLEEEDVLVDAMRGRSSTWTRIRLNLRHVPEELRPASEPADPDYDPWRR